MGSSNIYTFALSTIVTGFANYGVHNMLFDNSYVYTVYSGDIGGESVKTKGANPMGINARDLFNDVLGGVKLGYQSDLVGVCNYGIYASAHYRINQMKTKLPGMEDYSYERFQYMKPGMGVFLTFGTVERKVKAQIEAAVRYDLAINYKGVDGTESKDAINNGLSTHFALKAIGYTWFSGGVFADFCHYHLFDDSSFKPYSFGVTFTITPKRGEDYYGHYR